MAYGDGFLPIQESFEGQSDDSDDDDVTPAESKVKDGRDGLPTPTADHIGELWYDKDGNLFLIEQEWSAAEPPQGTWSEYTANNYEGVHGDGYERAGSSGHYYYNTSHHQFTLMTYNPGGAYWEAFWSWTYASPTTVLGSNAHWLGEFENARDALHTISTYDSTKVYYAFFDNKVQVLDGSTYVAAVTPQAYYDWARIGGEHATDILGLRQNLVQYEERVPTAADGVDNTNSVFIDELNGNSYVTSEDGGWRFIGSRDGTRKNAYIGVFTEYTGGGATTDVGIDQFYQFETDLYIGATLGSDIAAMLSEIEGDEQIFIGSEQFNINTASLTVDGTKVVFYFNGAWVNDFDMITFDSPATVLHTRPFVFQYETIWSGTVGQASSDQDLDVGKKFSDYEMLSFQTHRLGMNANVLVSRAEFEVRTILTTAGGRSLSAEYVSDTQWKTPAGSNGLNLKQIDGVKVR